MTICIFTVAITRIVHLNVFYVLQVWDLFFDADNVRNLIIRKVKEESLRTYLFSYSAVYDSLDLELLAAMFDLDRPVVHSIISKMIINEELMVTKVSGFILFYMFLLILFSARVPDSLQYLRIIKCVIC